MGLTRERLDSTVGKVLEKVGHVVHNEGLVAKGAEKREAERRLANGQGEEEGPFAN
jgi:uncharacterized protein YjbJ (UPF0337 family)